MSKISTLLVDGHVHIYPHYDLLQTFRIGTDNFRCLAKKIFKGSNSEEVAQIWLLAERYDCNFFEQTVKSPAEFKNDFKFLPGNEKEVIIVQKNGNPIFYVLAGRQIVTKEGLEVLSLVSTLFLKDREKSIDDVIKSVNDSNGIAVLNWAPGKWFFTRGKVVKRILEEYPSNDLVVSDTPLRNTLWPVPRLISAAQKRGFKVIAGSDPLPFKGEEKYVGSYGFCLTGEFNHDRPAESVRLLLKSSKTNISLIGKRNDFITFCRRQYKIMANKYLKL